MEKQKKQKPLLPAAKHTLAAAKKEVLSDDVLQNVANSRLLDAIRKDMLQRSDKQSRYLVRAWLGIQELCQNAQDLEVSSSVPLLGDN